jgi:hypothetical protein
MRRYIFLLQENTSKPLKHPAALWAIHKIILCAITTMRTRFNQLIIFFYDAIWQAAERTS